MARPHWRQLVARSGYILSPVSTDCKNFGGGIFEAYSVIEQISC